MAQAWGALLHDQDASGTPNTNYWLQASVVLVQAVHQYDETHHTADGAQSVALALFARLKAVRAALPEYGGGPSPFQRAKLQAGSLLCLLWVREQVLDAPQADEPLRHAIDRVIHNGWHSRLGTARLDLADGSRELETYRGQAAVALHRLLDRPEYHWLHDDDHNHLHAALTSTRAFAAENATGTYYYRAHGRILNTISLELLPRHGTIGHWLHALGLTAPTAEETP